MRADTTAGQPETVVANQCCVTDVKNHKETHIHFQPFQQANRKKKKKWT